MRTARSRMPKDFCLEDRLAACARAVASDPAAWAGNWNAWVPEGDAPRTTPYKEVRLDLGCGKGEYTVACAKAEPDVLFVGLDIEGVCVMRAAELALAEGVTNAVFIFDRDPVLTNMFAPHELDCILLNFPTPFPKKKKAPFRLTYVDRLMIYRDLLAPGATVRLRTDSQPLRDFSLTQFEIAGYELKWNTDNVRSLFPEEPWSGYEIKLVAQGATVYGCEAVPGPAPEHVEQTALLSLVSYLPEDIESLGYVPHGMQGCVANMRGRRANQRSRGIEQLYTPPKI